MLCVRGLSGCKSQKHEVNIQFTAIKYEIKSTHNI